MTKKEILSVIGRAISFKVASQSHIARDLAIDPSQVSRVINGQFVRPAGRALQICNYCQGKLIAVEPDQQNLRSQLDTLGQRLVTGDPAVAAAVVVLLNALAPSP